MRKLLALCLLLATGCAGAIFTPKHPVIEEYRGSYLASVSICNKSGKAYGSGTIIHHKAGEPLKIITAAHVVDGEKRIFACFSYTNKMAELVTKKINDVHDVALLVSMGTPKKDGPFARVSKHNPKIGDKVFVIGAPLGEQFTVTTGIISNYYKQGRAEFYRTDAACIFGNSGGGIFNMEGELISLVSRGKMLHPVVPIPVPGGTYGVALPLIKNILK